MRMSAGINKNTITCQLCRLGWFDSCGLRVAGCEFYVHADYSVFCQIPGITVPQYLQLLPFK